MNQYANQKIKWKIFHSIKIRNKKLRLKVYIPNYIVIVGKNVSILRFSGLYA